MLLNLEFWKCFLTSPIEGNDNRNQTGSYLTEISLLTSASYCFQCMRVAIIFLLTVRTGWSGLQMMRSSKMK